MVWVFVCVYVNLLLEGPVVGQGPEEVHSMKIVVRSMVFFRDLNEALNDGFATNSGMCVLDVKWAMDPVWM